MAVEPRTFRAALDCHYLLDPGDGLFVAALHGYGSSPEVMLRLTRGLLGPPHTIAALAGPSHFYTATPGGPVGYSWATHARSESSIRLHHEMLLRLFDECDAPPQRRLLIGFSQPVGMNYRFAATHPGAVAGVVGICGGVPRNWESGPEYHAVSAALLHIARREDEFYPEAATAPYAQRLGARAARVEFHLLEGGHRFPSKASPIVEAWLRQTFHL
ncbi:MAG: alpha/beta hydrolase [Bryobacteraceae bacterium]